RRSLRIAALSAGAAGLMALPLISEVRLKRATRPLTERWQEVPIEARLSTRVGISFRPPQVEALGLDPRTTMRILLRHPFQIIRLGAYWNRIDPPPGRFQPDELDA